MTTIAMRRADALFIEESERQMFVTLRINGQLFGIPVEHVRDVFKEQKMARVPLAPSEIAGLINLRGRIVTVIDMRKRLNLPPKSDRKPHMCVVVEHRSEYFSLFIDTVGEVMTMAVDEIETGPANMEPGWQDITYGVCKLAQELLIIIDIQSLLRMPLGDEGA